MSRTTAIILVLGSISSAAPELPGDELQLPEIADVPVSVDPATLVPEALAKRQTVRFSESELQEVAAWVSEASGTPVLFDSSALENAGILMSEPVTDQLNDAPLYLLLNRLQALNLSWYVRDEVIMITTTAAASQRYTTQSYALGDLLDAGYTQAKLTEAIQAGLPAVWEEENGDGGNIEWLGDVLFLRQTSAVHWRMQGLLQALRQHARQTHIFAPPAHEELRRRLSQETRLEMVDVPLKEAVRQIAESNKINLRLDYAELRRLRIRDRVPVSLILIDRPLKTILRLLLAEHDLTWVLQDGVVLITSQEKADRDLTTAVYDVRDLCRNADEAAALEYALYSQTSGAWEETDGRGGSQVFVRNGTLVIRQAGQIHNEILELLEAYRSALRQSRPREQQDPRTKVITRYYRLQRPVALVLQERLSDYVEPDTWKTATRPDAVGSIDLVPSGMSADDFAYDGDTGQAVLLERGTLIITQTRGTHEKIEEFITRLTQGDGLLDSSGMKGGGGFGGGFFSIQATDDGTPNR